MPALIDNLQATMVESSGESTVRKPYVLVYTLKRSLREQI
jgi:hypothetical protein